MACLLDANVFIAANNLHYQVHDTLRDVAPRTRTVCPLGSLMSDQTNERAFETHVEETLLGGKRSVGPWSRTVECIIHIEWRPLNRAGNAISDALSSNAWRCATRISAPT